MPLPDVPTLSISYSALAQWARCERSFWLSRVGAWQAWRGGTRAGDPEAAAAYRNKHIVSADQLLGIVVHELAAEVVTAIRDGRRPPLREELHRTLRARLAAVWRRDRDAFIEAPKGRIIHEHFYGVQHRAAALEVLRAKVGAAIRRLVESELLQDLMEADRGEIITVDSLDATAFTGGGGLPVVPLYAAADLVLCSATRSVHVDGVRLEPPVPQIVELKTSMRLREAEVRLQLATLAIHARDRLGLEPHARTGAYAGRVVDLSPRGRPTGTC